MELDGKKIRKYEVAIELNDVEDAESENIAELYNFLMELVNELLDDDVTVLVARIPDDFAIDQIEEEDVEVVMAYLREEFSTRAPKVFILGSCFDIKCTNKPDKIVMWPEIMELAFSEEPEDSEESDDSKELPSEEFKKAIDDMVNKMNTPKIITPNILI